MEKRGQNYAQQGSDRQAEDYKCKGEVSIGHARSFEYQASW
jgi:hypothetical protein